ncbi:MAG: hypothetical protein R2852_03145 [Bacteroidia bacterium]
MLINRNCIVLFSLFNTTGVFAQTKQLEVENDTIKNDQLKTISIDSSIQIRRPIERFFKFQETDIISKTSIIEYRNDSLYVPDSFMENYVQINWMSDSFGEVPKYYDSMTNGWLITWTEYYTDGYFYIQLYKNYLVAGIGHNNPNPNLIFYVQKISEYQFNTITEHIINEKLSKTVSVDKYQFYGKTKVGFSLNEKAMGLYTVKDVESKYYSKSKGEYTLTQKDADKQFRDGLIGFLKSVNTLMTEKIPLPDKNKLGYDYAKTFGISVIRYPKE